MGLIHLAEMKYNRMIMYPDNILHGAYDKPGYFEDDIYRLVQTFFHTLTFFLMIILTGYKWFYRSSI